MISWAWPHPSPYALFNGFGLIAALFLLDSALKRQIPWAADRLYCIFVCVLPFAWLGAHTLDMFVNHRSFAAAGFVFYGGLLTGALLFAAVGSLLTSMDAVRIAANAAVVPLLVAQAFGRIGCFFAGCCYGTHCDLLGARHPTQLYEASFTCVSAVLLTTVWKRGNTRRVLWYLLTYPVFRFAVEFLRDDARGECAGLSTSQWVSLGLFTAGLCLATRQSHSVVVEPFGRANRCKTPQRVRIEKGFRANGSV